VPGRRTIRAAQLTRAIRSAIFYGNPQAPSLGPLGAYPDDVLVARTTTQWPPFSARRQGRARTVPRKARIVWAVRGFGQGNMESTNGWISRIFDSQVAHSSASRDVPVAQHFGAHARQPSTILHSLESSRRAWIGTPPSGTAGGDARTLCTAVLCLGRSEQAVRTHEGLAGIFGVLRSARTCRRARAIARIGR
jgi:hypothetical protein